MPPKPAEVLRRALRDGWVIVGGKGSHRKLWKDGKYLVIPYHTKELKKGMWEQIRRDAGWR